MSDTDRLVKDINSSINIWSFLISVFGTPSDSEKELRLIERLTNNLKSDVNYMVNKFLEGSQHGV